MKKNSLSTATILSFVIIAAVFILMAVRLPEVKEPTRQQMTGAAKYQGLEYVKRVEGR